MPNPYAVAFELILVVLFGLCVRHALRFGPARVWQLVAGVIFGVLLETATIQQLHAYHYGRFLLMIGDVPLMVGVGWGVIIYSARVFSDATSLPEWARPLLDGLLALNIDLALDAVAIRLGLWDWGHGLAWQYFGVPYANFWAWFWVVFSFSVGIRALARPTSWAGRWLGPVGAILVGLIDIVAMNSLIVSLPVEWYVPTVILTLGVALALVLSLRPRLSGPPADPLVFWAPFGFHVYCLAAGLLSLALLRPPILLLVSLAMMGLALYLHRGYFAPRFKKPPIIDGQGAR
jgi:Carotenoid biosynthesis protein